MKSGTWVIGIVAVLVGAFLYMKHMEGDINVDRLPPAPPPSPVQPSASSGGSSSAGAGSMSSSARPALPPLPPEPEAPAPNAPSPNMVAAPSKGKLKGDKSPKEVTAACLREMTPDRLLQEHANDNPPTFRPDRYGTCSALARKDLSICDRLPNAGPGGGGGRGAQSEVERCRRAASWYLFLDRLARGSS